MAYTEGEILPFVLSPTQFMNGIMNRTEHVVSVKIHFIFHVRKYES